jgi:hypothetical protein
MDKSNSFLISSCIGFAIILILFISSITYYSINTYTKKIPDQKSINKIDQINNIFISLFGNNWFIILISFSVFIIFFILMLYIISKKEITININDDKYNKFFITSLIFIIIFSGGIIAITIKTITKNNQANSPIDKYYEPAITYNNTQQILEVVGLSAFILFSIFGAVWYFKRKPPNTS